MKTGESSLDHALHLAVYVNRYRQRLSGIYFRYIKPFLYTRVEEVIVYMYICIDVNVWVRAFIYTVQGKKKTCSEDRLQG